VRPISEPLLRYLRDVSSSPSLAFSVEPTSIALGAETWVFGFELREAPPDLTGPLVLRLFPEDADPEQARFESVVQNTMADLGYPAPRTPLVCTDPAVLGGTFLVMERIGGKMMFDALFGGNVFLHAPKLIVEALSRMPRALARHQLALHALDARPLKRALEKAALPERLYTVEGWIEDLRQRTERADLGGLRVGIDWLTRNRPPDPKEPTVCHCDFLAPNLIVDGERLVGVIDWSHLTLAHPEWDVANTRLRMKINPLEVPRLLQAIASLMRGRTTRVYEQAYEEERRVDRDLLAYYEVLLSHSFLVTIGEHRKDPASTGSTEGRSPNQWLIPGNEIPLVRHCSALAGLDLKLP
jgi:aminoglycoside phosphotransferase (APT) family kinase protein